MPYHSKDYTKLCRIIQKITRSYAVLFKRLLEVMPYHSKDYSKLCHIIKKITRSYAVSFKRLLEVRPYLIFSELYPNENTELVVLCLCLNFMKHEEHCGQYYNKTLCYFDVSRVATFYLFIEKGQS